jgi:hypothetical protein
MSLNLEENLVQQRFVEDQHFLLDLSTQKTLAIENLKKKGVVGPSQSVLCSNVEEIIIHLFVHRVHLFLIGMDTHVAWYPP